MSNPAYLWLTDENGSPMSGSYLVVGRVGAIEIKSLTHNINIRHYIRPLCVANHS